MAYWILRLAGWRSGYFWTEDRLSAELKSIRRLLMEAGDGRFLPNAFANLRELVEDCRLLILERIENGTATIDGCIAYRLMWCICHDSITGQKMLRRINVLRLLAVRDCDERGQLAYRLALEGMLRGTIRSRYDLEDMPQAIGTLGVVFDTNERALGWAAKWPEVTIVDPDALGADSDSALRVLRDYAKSEHARLNLAFGCRFVVANRILLEDAAYLNLAGRTLEGPCGDGLEVRYDGTDPYEREIEVAVSNLVSGTPQTGARLGLFGDPTATIWGPLAVHAMGIEGIEGECGWEDFSS